MDARVGTLGHHTASREARRDPSALVQRSSCDGVSRRAVRRHEPQPFTTVGSPSAQTKQFNRLFWNARFGVLVRRRRRSSRTRCLASDRIRSWRSASGTSMLDEERSRKVVETVERELLTPVGLRSLSQQDPEYRRPLRGRWAEPRRRLPSGDRVGLAARTVRNGVCGSTRSGSSEARAQAARWLRPVARSSLGRLSRSCARDLRRRRAAHPARMRRSGVERGGDPSLRPRGRVSSRIDDGRTVTRIRWEGVVSVQGPLLARATNALAVAGRVVIRYGLVVVLLWIGTMKFSRGRGRRRRRAGGAKPVDVVGLFGVERPRLLRRARRNRDRHRHSRGSRAWALRLSSLGRLAAVGMFTTTLSFLVTTPPWGPSLGGIPALSATGQFLIKNFVLLGAAVRTLGEGLRCA